MEISIMAELIYDHSDKEKKCRICDEVIHKGDLCFVMKDVHVSPKRVNLFFHRECLLGSIQELEGEGSPKPCTCLPEDMAGSCMCNDMRKYRPCKLEEAEQFRVKIYKDWSPWMDMDGIESCSSYEKEFRCKK
jgi:hypothetical protein